MNIFLVTLRKELLEQWRTRRWVVVAAVLVFFALLSPAAARYTPEIMKLLPNGAAMAKLAPPPTVMDAVKQYLKNLSQFGLVLALLVTMGSVAREKDRGTAAMMLVKPLPRATFLGAKFTALTLVFMASLAAAALAGFCYTAFLFSAPNVTRWIALNALVLVYITVQVAVTLLCSVIAKSQIAAGGLAFAAITALAFIAAIPRFGKYLPGQLIGWAGELMARLPTTHWATLFVCLGIISTALFGAWFLFERQEL